MQVSVGRHLTTDTTRVDNLTVRLQCLLADFIDVEPVASTDHDVLRWVPAGELTELDWAPADLPAVTLLSTQA